MTRPRKDVVDFFPHYIARGKTIPILEKKYGNDGYAFWWKTLEILGMAEGHYFDCNNPVNWEYLQTYTLVSEDIANEILNMLARLDAIDKKLWSKKVIWTGNFIENLTPLYSRRTQKPPTKEEIVNILSLSDELLHTETPPTGINDNINPHSIVEYSRVEKPPIVPQGGKVKKIKNRKSNGYSEDFELFWQTIVHRPDDRKKDAFIHWQKATDIPPINDLLETVKKYNLSKRNTEPDKILATYNWIKNQLYLPLPQANIPGKDDYDLYMDSLINGAVHE